MADHNHHLRGVERLSTTSALLESAFNFAIRKRPPWAVRHPDDLIPGDAKDLDAAAILHAAGTPYSDSAMLLATRQYYALMRKNSFLETSASIEDRKQACFNKFVDAQSHNRITVKRLNHYLRRPSRMPSLLADVLGSAQMDVFHLLGPEPEVGDWKRFTNAKVYSNGTVQGLRPMKHPKTGLNTPFKDTTAYGKLSEDATVTSTRDCLVKFGRYLCNGEYGKYLLSRHQDGELVTSSQGTTVPKDAVVDRFIAIEPCLNGMAQQGILSMLAYHLKKWGITLRRQERNRELAKEASIIGCNIRGWSTIDLSSASDTITEPLVRYLIPKGWRRLLDAARTNGVTLDGKEVEGYSSYCTMGNAFTFPLQCIIFAALTRSAIKASRCEKRDYRVYGDDIIVPSSASLLLIEALKFAGFIPNVHKSFVHGFFRESCGGDYLHGQDVAPVVLADDILLQTTKHVLFNRLQRSNPEHPLLWPLYESVSRPLYGPAIDRGGVSDSYFECPEYILHDRRRGWYDKKCQTIKFRVPGLVPVSRKVRKTNTIRAYLSALLGAWGERHDLRGSQRYHVRDIQVDMTYRLPEYSPLWYAQA